MPDAQPHVQPEPRPETLDPKACYAALLSRDARFDGHFFAGVSSTGIYCRPTCRAKVPKPENCTYFRTAAEAEAAGYRPCLQCRPETAPGLSPADAMTSLAQRTARAIEDDPADIGSLEELAGRLGYTSRHVRRAFEQEFHVSPQQYLRTCRLLLAKNLLTETDLPVAEVARACGFGSVRRFNDAFVGHYRLAPTSLRRRATTGGVVSAGAAGAAVGTIRVTLGYRPPYAWGRILDFLAARAIPGVEKVDLPEGVPDDDAVGKKAGRFDAAPDHPGSYARAVRLPAHVGTLAEGWIRVTHHPCRDALVLEAADTLAPVLPQVIARVKDLFDLRCDPDAIARGLASMADLDLRLPIAGLRVPGCFEPFEMAVRAVLGQQVSVRAATTLAGRVACELGTPVETPLEGVVRCFRGRVTLLPSVIASATRSGSWASRVRGSARLPRSRRGLRVGRLRLATARIRKRRWRPSWPCPASGPGQPTTWPCACCAGPTPSQPATSA